MATVTHVVHDDGSQSIGVKDGKQFVPFATLSAARYEQLRENAENTQSGENDEEKKGGEK